MIHLANLCVMVTRPDPSGMELCTLIQASGGEAVHFPTLDFAQAPDVSAYQHAIKKLGEYEWLIFISPQSVYSSVADIRQIWPVFPTQVKFAAIGEGTARALQGVGYNVTALPLKEWNSEALLDLPEFQSAAINKKKIAIIRGEGGREMIDTILADRGASVLSVIAYQRVLPKVDIGPYMDLLKRARINVIVCTSFESVRNLKTLFGEAGWPFLHTIPLVVVSDRIKMLAQDLGFQSILVSQNASQKAILDVLSEELSRGNIK